VGSNRDESFDRPALDVHFWETEPDESLIFAGKDMEAKGTWLGIRALPVEVMDQHKLPKFRFALLTNYREFNPATDKITRGKLVTDFLRNDSEHSTHIDYGEKLLSTAANYNGYNLILGGYENLLYLSNRSTTCGILGHGVHGLSNANLNSSWKKVQEGREMFKQAVLSFLEGKEIEEEKLIQELLSIMSNKKQHPDDPNFQNTPDKRNDCYLGLSSIFVEPIIFDGRKDYYGTRSQCIMLVRADGSIKMTSRNLNIEKSTWDINSHELKASK